MAQNISLSTELSQNIDLLHRLLPLGKSFDLITRDLRLGETPAFWLGINGFCNTEILQQIFSDLQDPHYTLDSEILDLPGYVQSRDDTGCDFVLGRSFVHAIISIFVVKV